MSAPIKPLHVGKFVPPPYGGIEDHIDLLLRSLPPEASATLVAGEGAQPAAQQQRSYRILEAPMYGKVASATLSPGVLRLVHQEIKSGRANLLHLHVPNPWADLATLMSVGKVPIVMTWHSDIVRQKKLMLAYQFLQKAVLKRVDKIVVFTPKHYDSSVQLHQLDVRHKIVQVPVGIDFSKVDEKWASPLARERIDGFAQGRPVLLTVGRHVPYKGYTYLLQAVAKMRTDAVLVMVGNGELTPQLQQQVEQLGLSERVLMLGQVDNGTLVAALHQCDVFCLPSVQPSEAFGIAAAEAMACGKPTVVCELNNGVNYLNQHGLTGLTVPPRDVPALADALDQLAGNPTQRQVLGAYARQWVHDQFSVAAMCDGTMALYRQLLA